MLIAWITAHCQKWIRRNFTRVRRGELGTSASASPAGPPRRPAPAALRLGLGWEQVRIQPVSHRPGCPEEPWQRRSSPVPEREAWEGTRGVCTVLSSGEKGEEKDGILCPTRRPWTLVQRRWLRRLDTLQLATRVAVQLRHEQPTRVLPAPDILSTARGQTQDSGPPSSVVPQPSQDPPAIILSRRRPSCLQLGGGVRRASRHPHRWYGIARCACRPLSCYTCLPRGTGAPLRVHARAPRCSVCVSQSGTHKHQGQERGDELPGLPLPLGGRCSLPTRAAAGSSARSRGPGGDQPPSLLSGSGTIWSGSNSSAVPEAAE